ncbi:MAG TPA: M67 family metallopeptidase [Anaerolineales bacterium]|nr:M67 family metallopeptidase [Anaerolineales bacterium]
MKSFLILNKQQVHKITDYLNGHMPMEACGLLAGKNDRVEKVLFVRNQAQSPVRFVMDPYEQLKAFDWIDDNELDLLGIFHSHPSGPETASPTDIAEAAYEVIHIICSRKNGQWKLRGFWIENREATEVTLQIVD